MNTFPLSEYRCTCGRLLFRGSLVAACVEIKCKRCNAIVLYGAAARGGPYCYGLVLDAASRIRDVSETAPRVLGYTREELLSMRADELAPYRPSASEERGAVSYDCTHRAKDGTLLSVRASVQRDPESHGRGALCLFEVIGKGGALVAHDAPPKRAEAVPPFLAHVDCSGRYTYVSRGLGAFFGQVPLALLGASLFDLFGPAERGAQSERFSRMTDTRMPYVLSGVHIRSGTGELHPASLTFVPERQDDGRMRGYSLLIDPLPVIRSSLVPAKAAA